MSEREISTLVPPPGARRLLASLQLSLRVLGTEVLARPIAGGGRGQTGMAPGRALSKG